MKHYILLSAGGMLLPALLCAQTIMITFQGTLNGASLPLDSVLVLNLDQGFDTTLYSPDTVLVLGTTGIRDASSDAIEMRVMPNPFGSHTEFLVDSRGQEDLLLYIHDLAGRMVTSLNMPGGTGKQRVAFRSARPGGYVLSVLQGDFKSISLIIALEGEGAFMLEQIGQEPGLSKGGGGGFVWTPGDALRYIGFATDTIGTVSGSLEEVPTGSTINTFQFSRGSVCPFSPTLTDIDGNTYPVVDIGGQCWMAANLRTAHYRDGTLIPEVTDDLAWLQLSSGAWSNIDNDPLLDSIYGKLYNWYTMVDPSELCPSGWHVPTDTEWQELELALGMSLSEVTGTGWRGDAQNVGGKMKAELFWESPNIGTTNESGFSGIPGGARSSVSGGFNQVLINGFWWSASTSSASAAYYRSLRNLHGDIRRNSASMVLGASVRCVQD